MTEEARSPAGALQVRVRSITWLAENINAYEVVALDGAPLPSFSAGAHVDLYFRDGRIRQYSLCNDPRETHRYVFAVQREDGGRGGSKAVHDVVHAGRVLTVSLPRNHFPLHESAEHHVLIAGGIGITPIMAMIHRLLAIGARFELHYAARSHDKLAFLDQVSALGVRDRLRIHVDGGDPGKGMRPREIVEAAPKGSHFYTCGPQGLMRAMREATAHLPSGVAHFEHFAAPVEPTSATATPKGIEGNDIAIGFKVELARSGGTFTVPDDKSIIEVLRENGVRVETSCEAGVCGTCRTRYLAGEPEHHDFVLDDEERRHEVLICCARSKSRLLVLDL